MKRIALIVGLTLALAACSSSPERAEPPRPGPQASTISQNPDTRQCFAALGAAGNAFTPLPDRYTGAGCSMLGTVQLNAIATDQSSAIATNLGPVACPVSNAFAAWARFGVDRAARVMLGSPLRSIETFGSYSCRNIAGSGRRSAHSQAEAIDVAAFVLADGRRISVKQDWSGGSPEEREFLRTVRQSACRRFDIVLSPDYNEDHEDHFHLEGVIGQKSFCR